MQALTHKHKVQFVFLGTLPVNTLYRMNCCGLSPLISQRAIYNLQISIAAEVLFCCGYICRSPFLHSYEYGRRWGTGGVEANDTAGEAELCTREGGTKSGQMKRFQERGLWVSLRREKGETVPSCVCESKRSTTRHTKRDRPDTKTHGTTKKDKRTGTGPKRQQRQDP